MTASKTEGTVKHKGTCGACFRAMVLTTDGKVVRHGWKEEGATRRAGEYGNVYHSGPCFGVGWLPYEKSPACTSAFVEEVLFPMACSVEAHLDYLATRPAFLFCGRISSIPFRAEKWEGRFEVMVRDGDPKTWGALSRYGETLYPDNYSEVPSYDTLHAKYVEEAQEKLQGIRTDALFCLKRVDTWTPAETKPLAPTVQILHAVHPTVKRVTACGRRMWSMSRAVLARTTLHAEEVNCPRCKELHKP